MCDFEVNKHENEVKHFHESFASIMKMDIPREDLVHMFPIFTGSVNLARFLFFYELYKETLNVGGHIAEVGIWKGASFFFWAKLISIFEPHSLTQVHGFEWFQGMSMNSDLDDKRYEGDHKASKETVETLLKLQNLDGIGLVHNFDVSKDLGSFFEQNKSLEFKIVFLDCGSYNVLKESIRYFWPRINKRGIMIFDHPNQCAVPQESIAIREYFGNDVEMKSMPFCRWPSGYIVK